jgi:hypothetical protein
MMRARQHVSASVNVTRPEQAATQYRARGTAVTQQAQVVDTAHAAGRLHGELPSDLAQMRIQCEVWSGHHAVALDVGAEQMAAPTRA